ncbi:MAG: response regulator, partial [Gammaproteobacteria bacterium]|nr:response regulator [Gammaproteobacteria bacterium]
MSDDKKCILIVDDSPEDIQFIMENIKDEFSVLVATNGQKALELAWSDNKPDLILMDVMMPEMDGYETCKALKSDPESKDIDVIFVSAHDTVDEMLAGYDAGGSDYLIKPIDTSVLLSKIKHAISNQELKKQHQEQASSAFETAMTAMSNIGEQGIIITFLRNIINLHDIKDLGDTIIDALRDFSLQSSIKVDSLKNTHIASSIGVVPPLERELLNRININERIAEHGRRAIFNYRDITLLIKDMPEDDDKRGRLRDHIAILLEGAEDKLSTMNSDTLV